MPHAQLTVDIAESLTRAESLCKRDPAHAYDIALQLHVAIDPANHPDLYARALRVMAESGIHMQTRAAYTVLVEDIPPRLQRIPKIDPLQQATIRAYVGVACVKLYAYSRQMHHIERARLYLWDALRHIPLAERDLHDAMGFAMLTVAQVMQRPDLTREAYQHLITLYEHHGESRLLWLARLGLWYQDVPLPVMFVLAPLLVTAAVPVWLALRIRRWFATQHASPDADATHDPH